MRFTLVNVLKWLLAAIIVIAVSMWSVKLWIEYREQQASSGEVKSLLLDLLRARQYAISHNASVMLCAKGQSGQSCGDDWQKGWLMYALSNAAATAVLQPREGDIQVRDQAALQMVRVQAKLTAQRILFSPIGAVNQGPDACFEFAGQADGEMSHQIVFRSEGRAQLQKVEGQ